MKSLLAAVATALLFAMPAFAQDPQVATLAASGNGAVQVVPDIAVVTLGVTSRAGTASAALAQNSTELTNALAAIRAGGVADKDIATSDFSIYPVTEQQDGQQTRPPKIIGYEVSNTVRVTIRDIASSGSLLDKVVVGRRQPGERHPLRRRRPHQRRGRSAEGSDRRRPQAGGADGGGSRREAGAHPVGFGKLGRRASAGVRPRRGSPAGAGDARTAVDHGERVDHLRDRAAIAAKEIPAGAGGAMMGR